MEGRCGIPPDIRLKYAFRREIRMLTIKSSTPFDQVVEQLRQNTLQMMTEAPPKGARLILRYVEDDLVTIYDGRDWEECLVYYAEELQPKGQKLKLFLEFETESSVPGGDVGEHLPPGWSSAQPTVLVTNQDRPRSKNHHIQSHFEGTLGSGDLDADDALMSVSQGTPCQLSLSRSGSNARKSRGGGKGRASAGAARGGPTEDAPSRKETANMSTSTTSLATGATGLTPSDAPLSTMSTQTVQPYRRPQSSTMSSQTDGPPLSGNAHPHTPEPVEKTARITGWVRGNLIGRGANSEVYFGMNQHAANFFAVKQTLIDRRDPEHTGKIKALQKEIELMSKHNHENIVRYLGSELRGNVFSIFLEFVPGGSIASLLSRFGSFHEKVVRLYTRQILQGLDFLHWNRVLHRDIKGANILVSDKGMVKLADFGCSKRLTVDSTGTKTLLGTALWMAPEVIRSSKYGSASDIWSVGCTVIEMASGKPPWTLDRKFDSEIQAMYHIANSGGAPRLPSHLSKNAKEFLRNNLHAEPDKRYPASQLLQHPFITEECVDINDISKSPSESLNDLTVRSNAPSMVPTEGTLLSTMRTVTDSTIEPPTTIASLTKLSVHASTFDPGSVASEIPRGDFDLSRGPSPEPSITTHRRAPHSIPPHLSINMSDASASQRISGGGSAAPTPVRRNVDDDSSMGAEAVGALDVSVPEDAAGLAASAARVRGVPGLGTGRRWSMFSEAAGGSSPSPSAQQRGRYSLPAPSEHSPGATPREHVVAREQAVPVPVPRDAGRWPVGASREGALTTSMTARHGDVSSSVTSLRGSLKWSNVTRPPDGAVEHGVAAAADRPQTSPSRSRVDTPERAGGDLTPDDTAAHALSQTQTTLLEHVRESLRKEKQRPRTNFAARAAGISPPPQPHPALTSSTSSASYVRDQAVLLDYLQKESRRVMDVETAGPKTPDAVVAPADVEGGRGGMSLAPREGFNGTDTGRYPVGSGGSASECSDDDAPAVRQSSTTPPHAALLPPRHDGADEMIALTTAARQPSAVGSNHSGIASRSDSLASLNRTAVHVDVSPSKAVGPGQAKRTPKDVALQARPRMTELQRIEQQIIEYEGVGAEEEDVFVSSLGGSGDQEHVSVPREGAGGEVPVPKALERKGGQPPTDSGAGQLSTSKRTPAKERRQKDKERAFGPGRSTGGGASGPPGDGTVNALSPKKRTHSRKARGNRTGHTAASAPAPAQQPVSRTKCRASVPIMPRMGGGGGGGSGSGVDGPASKYEQHGESVVGRRGSANASARQGRSRPRDMEYTDLEVDPQLLASPQIVRS